MTHCVSLCVFLCVQSPAAPLLASADVPPLRAVRLKPREPNVDVDRRAELERRKSVLHAAHMQELQRARKEGERGEAQANHDRAVKERAAMKKRAVAAKARGVRAAALVSPSFLSLSVSLSLVKRLTAIYILLIYIYMFPIARVEPRCESCGRGEERWLRWRMPASRRFPTACRRSRRIR